MPTSKSVESESTSPIAWGGLYHLLLRRAWLITACLAVAIFAGMAYLARTPKVYAARTVVQVEESETNIINIPGLTTEDAGTAELLKTIEQNFMSNDLLLRVAKGSELATNPRFLAGVEAKDASDELLLGTVRKAVSVKLRRGTRLLDIVAQHTDPEIAQLLAQTLVKNYLRSGFEEKVTMSQMANTFLIEEANRLKTKVEASENALQEYREKNGAASLEDKQNITVEALKELNLRYTESKGTRMKLEAERAQAEKLAGAPVQELLTLPTVAAWPAVVQAREALIAREMELRSLAERYRAEHPKHMQAQSQVSAREKELNETVRKAVAAVQVEYEAALSTEAQFQEALAKQQKQALELNRIAIPYNSLQRDVESDQAMYQAVLKRLKETEVAKGVDTNNIRLVESARVPKVPISPVPARIMVVSVLGGLVIGLGLVCLLHVTDSSLRTVDEAERQLGLPVLVAVPHDRKSKSTHDWEVLVRQPESQIAEAFRTLRTSLSVKHRDSRVILFTSASPAEGKSFCSANAAVAFAQMGFKTLLIDADLRRPRQAAIFDVKMNAGLTEHLEDGASPASVIAESKVPNLHLLSAGKVAHNPAELLRSGRLQALFADAALQQYERIVIDSAPVNAVSDTLNLVDHADSICLVVRSDKTPKRAVVRAYHELVEAGARTVGIALNRVPMRRGSDNYYYYGSGSGSYGSEGVYGAGRKKVSV